MWWVAVQQARRSEDEAYCYEASLMCIFAGEFGLLCSCTSKAQCVEDGDRDLGKAHARHLALAGSFMGAAASNSPEIGLMVRKAYAASPSGLC